MLRGPSSSANVFAAIASPGRSPLDAASPSIGCFTDDDSTNASDPPVSGSVDTTARATRIAPRNTVSKPVRHASSLSWLAWPGGGPPTLISAPSKPVPPAHRGRDQLGLAARIGQVDHDRHRVVGAAQLVGRRGQ